MDNAHSAAVAYIGCDILCLTCLWLSCKLLESYVCWVSNDITHVEISFLSSELQFEKNEN